MTSDLLRSRPLSSLGVLAGRCADVHSPACATLKEHLARCISALDSEEGWNLDDFCEFARMTWDTERLVSDPDLSWIYEERRAEAVA